MFGAPELPRRQPAPHVHRRPGVGDHVDLYGGYLGLVVDIDEAGAATVASRTIGGRVTETKFEVRLLRVSASVPLGFDQRVDRDWKRGALG